MERKLRLTLEDGKFSNVSDKRSKAMGAVKGKGNKTTEARFRFALVRAGIQGWKLNYKTLKGKPDVFFPYANVAIFLDGCFWHGCPQCGHIPASNSAFWTAKIQSNKDRDLRTTNTLEKAGIAVLRFWEHEIQKDTKSCIQKIVLCLADEKV